MTRQLNFFNPLDDQTRPPSGNGKLVDYGVQNEGSDYRVHVGYGTQHVCVFPTQSAKDFIEREDAIQYKTSASQVGYSGKTSEGYRAPISLLKGVQLILIPPDIYKKYPIINDRTMTTSEKGAKAVSIVVEMLKRGAVAFPFQASVITDKDLQIQGSDIVIKSGLKVQVKCDFRAGPMEYGGTGNVYLQTRECNPYKRY